MELMNHNKLNEYPIINDILPLSNIFKEKNIIEHTYLPFFPSNNNEKIFAIKAKTENMLFSKIFNQLF